MKTTSLILSLLVATSAIFANDSAPKPLWNTNDQKLEVMISEIELSKEQMTAISAAMKTERERHKETNKLPKEERKSQYTAASQATEKVILETLTPEQHEKYKALTKKNNDLRRAASQAKAAAKAAEAK